MGLVHLRSQLFTTDLVFTASVFALVFFFLALTINDSIANQIRRFESMKSRFYAEQVVSLITLNPGLPFDWNSSTVVYPGVVSSPNKLDSDKIDYLMSAKLNETFDLPHPAGIILEEVEESGYYVVNCSQYLVDKYSNCTYTDEPRSYRLLYSGDKVYRLQVIVDG